MQTQTTQSSLALAQWISAALGEHLPRLASPSWPAQAPTSGALGSEVYDLGGPALRLTYEHVTLKDQRLETAEQVLRGRSYTVSRTPHSGYPDLATSLTNGALPTHTRDPSAGWVGWLELPGQQWTLDASLALPRYVKRVRVYAFHEPSPGIALPRVTAEGALDTSYAPLGSLTPVSSPVAGQGTWLECVLETPVHLRNLRLAFEAKGDWTLLGEVEVQTEDYFTTTQNLRVSAQLGQSWSGTLQGVGAVLAVDALLSPLTQHQVSADAAGFALVLGVGPAGSTGALCLERREGQTLLIADTPAGLLGLSRSDGGSESAPTACAVVTPGGSRSLVQADTGAAVVAGPFVDAQGLHSPPQTGLLLARGDVAARGETQVIGGSQVQGYLMAGLSPSEPRLSWVLRA